MEEFREIKNHPGYFVSNLGRIRKGNDKIMSTPTNSKGYVIFVAMLNGKRVSRALHRVVAEAFLGDIAGAEVDHLDFDKTNNAVSNLEIVSRQENMRRFNASPVSLARNKNISKSRLQHFAQKRLLSPPKPKKDISERGSQPGRTKTGGRIKGKGGRRMFLTIPPEFKLPDGEAEARAVVIAALREFLNASAILPGEL